jgi:hypothetical protein
LPGINIVTNKNLSGMKKVLIVVLFFIAGSYDIARAQQTKDVVINNSGWIKIGEATVSFQDERNEILVTGSDRFASVKLKVLEASLELTKLEVYFETGDKQDIKVNKQINAQGESEEIEINGGGRNLRKVAVVYKGLPDSKDAKTLVELWGLKTNAVTN